MATSCSRSGAALARSDRPQGTHGRAGHVPRRGVSRVPGAARAALVVAVVGAFAACAQGTQLGIGGSGTGGTSVGPASSSSGTGGMPISSGLIGAPCPDGKCAEGGTCTLIGQTKYCTTACPPTCPQGTYCSIIAGNPICIPDLGQECDKCTAASDCKMPSDTCLMAPPGDTFCARDCTVDGMCPGGFDCVDMTSYASPDGGTDAGSGTGGGASGSDGGTGGGGSLPSAPTKWCVPSMGASCPCSDKRDGISHTCENTNTFGTCAGTESCNGKTSQWQGCTALTPAMEVCNGKDDNCNAQIDEGDPNQLCSGMGTLPNANWACNAGTCSLGACDPGWTAYPSGPTSQGCMCQVDAKEPNGSCGMATNVGMVTDVGGAPITIQGTLSSDTDVDVYTFTTVDTNEMTTNSYHVAITFTQPTTNNEFVMDVERGPICSDTPGGGATNVTSYDWCVDATNGTSGEAPCGTAPNEPHCTDHSSTYFLRVYRKAGVTGTCTQYQITISGGGGACDLTQTCM